MFGKRAVAAVLLGAPLALSGCGGGASVAQPHVNSVDEIESSRALAEHTLVDAGRSYAAALVAGDGGAAGKYISAKCSDVDKATLDRIATLLAVMTPAQPHFVSAHALSPVRGEVVYRTQYGDELGETTTMAWVTEAKGWVIANCPELP